MNELQIIDLEQKDITMWDFARIKSELESALAIYKTSVYTDETIKSAKDDKATLAKAKKLVEDRCKEFKETMIGDLPRAVAFNKPDKFEKAKLLRFRRIYSFTSHIGLYDGCPSQYKFYKEYGQSASDYTELSTRLYL